MESKKALPKSGERCARAFQFSPEEREGFNISGIAAVYGQRVDIGGYFEEEVVAGAITERALQDVVFLANHDFDVPAMARSRRNNANSTLQLSITERGLEMAANIDTQAHYMAAAVFSAIKRGDLDGMSMVFFVARDEWSRLDTDYPLRKILEISRIYEVSAVNFPAYSQTQISARGEGQGCPDLVALENAKRAYLASGEGLELEKNKIKLKRRLQG